MSRRGRRRALITLPAVALSLLAAPSAAVAVDADSDGLDAHGVTTYTVDTDAAVVHVEVTLDLRNATSSVRRGNFIESYHFNSYGFPVVGDPQDLVAVGPNGPLDASVVVDDEGFQFIELPFRSNLHQGVSREITVTFDLTNAPPRTRDVTRVNEAYAAFFVAAVGDSGQADVRIETPRDFDLGIAATDLHLRSTRQGERLTLEATAIDDVDLMYFPISFVAEDALTSTVVEFDEVTVDVRGWPADATWSSFTSDVVERGLPVLEQLVGHPLADPTLEVLETSGGSHLGYAGFFRLDGTIEVSDALDAETLLHELTHAWINSGLFTERWLHEGFTQEVTRRAAVNLDHHTELLPTLDTSAEVAVPLNEWGYADAGLPGQDDAHELWGYDSSYALVNRLLVDVSDERLAEVLGAALRGEIAYRGDGERETLVVADDWQYVLDLLEEVGGVEASDTFRDHVVSTEDLLTLHRREEAREDYVAFADASDGWTAPRELRTAMARWRFADVDDLIAESQALLDRAAALGVTLAELGGALPPQVEVAYESGRTFGAVDMVLTDAEELAARLTEQAARRADASLVERVGLLGPSVGLHRDAVAAASAGQIADAAELSDQLDERLAAASSAGGVRLAGAGIILLVVLAARRRRRRPVISDPATLP